MIDKRRSFTIIACSKDLHSQHTQLVASGRGVPHEPLTLFYEELQKSCTPGTLRSIMGPLLSFFSFLEEPQSLGDATLPCTHEEWSSGMEAWSLPPTMTWAAPPPAIQAAVRAYLAARWGCRTWPHGRHEDIRLSFSMQGEQQVHRFLAALQRFYRFCIERRYYWYERNPAEVFRLSLCSRLLQAIESLRLSLRSLQTGNQRNVAVVISERPGQTVRELGEKVPVLV
jgi:hypothetical protein